MTPSVRAGLDLESYRRFHSANLFCAVRDSLTYPTPPTAGAGSANTRNCRNYQVRKAEELRAGAREWIRAKGMENDRSGHGFGYVWDSLDFLGVISVHIDAFVAEMDRIWTMADTDPMVGRRFIQMMHNILIENGATPSNICRQRKRLHLRRVA